MHPGEDAYQDEHLSVSIKLCESKFGKSFSDFIADINALNSDDKTCIQN